MFAHSVTLGPDILRTIHTNVREITAGAHVLAPWLIVVLVGFHLHVFKEFEHDFWSPVYFNLGILSGSDPGSDSEFMLILFQI